MLLTKLANQEIMDFLKTVTIKNSYFAEQLKSELVNEAYQSGLPEDKNPYYLHLTGQYILKDDLVYSFKDPVTGITYTRKIPATTDIRTNDETDTIITVRNSLLYKEGAFDEMMYVTSLDVPGTQIPFTRELLHGDAASATSAVHKKTREAYRVPGKYFDMLCKRYPKQIDLIKSIVYLAPKKELSDDEIASLGHTPSDSELRFMTVRDAEHLSLISYDSSILEDRERDNIVAAVQAFLDLIRTRWDVKEYTMLEAGYANVHWAMIWSLLPLVIQAQRYSNIRTYQVHSSHIWDHLISNGLSSYKGYLTPDEEWYLYKNIRYLRENAGQHRILNYLIDNLLANYGFHIESKTSILDKTNILAEIKTMNDSTLQCDKCARRSICYKNIRSAKCNLFIGYSTKYKPTAVILSEELYGAQEKKILATLMGRYGYTKESAKERYDLSFMWRDEEIIAIRNELDREQIVDMTGTTEELATVFQREHAAKLEPVYSTDIIDDQQTDLRHVKSTYLPTKLLEIVEDRKEPKYHDLFIKFLRDTLLHLTIPGKINGIKANRISNAYQISCGQDAALFNLTYNELLALLYYGMYREEVLDVEVAEYNNGGTRNPNTGDNTVIDTTLLTDNKSEFNNEFHVPTSAYIGTSFKLGKPIRVQDLIAAYYLGQPSSSINRDGIVEYDSDKNDGTGIYAIYNETVEDGETVRTPIFNLVTNGSNATRLVKVGEEIYAVEARKIAEGDDMMWAERGVVISILGKYYTRYGTLVYHENNDEIPILPEYFIWHKEHLGLRLVENISDLSDSETLEDGEYAVAWNLSTGPVLYKYSATNKVWNTVTRLQAPTIVESDLVNSQGTVPYTGAEAVTFIAPAVDSKGPFSSFSQNLEVLNQDGGLAGYCYYGIDPMTGLIHYVDDGENEIKMYSRYKQFINTGKAEIYSVERIEKFVNVDWILENLWIDFMAGASDQDELGIYIENMFSIYERLDAIRSSCGDIKTRLAIDAFMAATLIKRGRKDIDMLPSVGLASPTYKQWFDLDADIRTNISKLNNSNSEDDVWNSLNNNIMSALLKGCSLNYISSTSDKTRYNRLRDLIKSLSSYLINIIDTADQTRMSVELPHTSSDTGKYELVFTSHVNFDYVGETLNRPPVRDPNKDIYILETADKPVEGRVYFRISHSNQTDSCDYINLLDLYGQDEYTAKLAAVWGTVDLFYKINLHELLGTNAGTILQLVSDNDVWQYHAGELTEIIKEVETFAGDMDIMRVRDAKIYDEASKLASDPELLGSRLYFKDILVDTLEFGPAVGIAKSIQDVLKLTRLKFILRTSSKYSDPNISERYLVSDELPSEIITDEE